MILSENCLYFDLVTIFKSLNEVAADRAVRCLLFFNVLNLRSVSFISFNYRLVSNKLICLLLLKFFRAYSNFRLHKYVQT